MSRIRQTDCFDYTKMENDNKDIQLRKIDLGEAYKKILLNKRLFVVTLTSALIVGSIIIFSLPRYYICKVKLAPETSASASGSLGSLASSFGLNLPNVAQQDAIIPEFYPDIIESVDFQAEMFPVNVSSQNGKLKTTYYNYLCCHQRYAWWTRAMTWITGSMKKRQDSMLHDRGIRVNPFQLTKVQYDIADMIDDRIKCDVNKKTDVITITVKDQDPLICATIADSAKNKLQQFIIGYRTSKARNDLTHAQHLCTQAKARYIKAQQVYATYMDTNEDVVLQRFKSKQEEMENEVQLRYNNYQLTTQQVQLAQAKLQERTPAFTTLQSATVPLKPASPKRALLLLLLMLCTFAVTSLYVVIRQ